MEKIQGILNHLAKENTLINLGEVYPEDYKFEKEELLKLKKIGYDVHIPEVDGVVEHVDLNEPDLELEEIKKCDGEIKIAPQWGNVDGTAGSVSWFPNTHWVVGIGNINIRAGAGTNFAVIGTLQGGSMTECTGRAVSITPTHGQWFRRLTSLGGFVNEFTGNANTGALTFNTRLTRRIGSRRVRVNAGGANIRRWPGSNTGVPIVRFAAAGTIFTDVGFDTNMTGIWGNLGIWVRVGAQQWIHGDLLTII